jgi:hypothetical protein
MTKREQLCDRLAFAADRLLTLVIEAQVAAISKSAEAIQEADDAWLKASCEFGTALTLTQIEAGLEARYGPRPACEVVRVDDATPELRPVPQTVADAVVDLVESVEPVRLTRAHIFAMLGPAPKGGD